MTQPNEDRLFFYSKEPGAAEKTLGKKKPLDPKSLLPSQPNQQPSIQPQNPSELTGKFAYDYLLQHTEIDKSKKIVKTDKKKFYRTKMCPYGLQCKKRFTCTFAHNQRQLRKPFKKRTQPCKLYQMGQCQLGAACKDYHGNMDLKKKNYKYKVDICPHFLKGNCGKGQVCIFKHQRPEQPSQEEENSSQQKLIQPEIQQQEGAEKQQQQEEPASVPPKKIEKKEIVSIVEQKIGSEQLVDDGLTITFNFN